MKILPDFSGGLERIRTAVRGFADLCLTTRPSRRARPAVSRRLLGRRLGGRLDRGLGGGLGGRLPGHGLFPLDPRLAALPFDTRFELLSHRG